GEGVAEVEGGGGAEEVRPGPRSGDANAAEGQPGLQVLIVGERPQAAAVDLGRPGPVLAVDVVLGPGVAQLLGELLEGRLGRRQLAAHRGSGPRPPTTRRLVP